MRPSQGGAFFLYMKNGWIKLHRQFRESPYYRIGAAVQTWVECLLRASHEQRTVFLKRERVVLEQGQFVMGRDEFGHSIGISGSTAWYWLLQFESDGMIDIKKTTKGSVVTVKNWNDYQKIDSESDNGRTADEQQKNTNKKDKNVKNEKNTYVDPVTKSSFDFIDELCKQSSINNKVKIKALDMQIQRYQKSFHLRTEIRNCITWMIDHGLRDITTMRLANWFKKAHEINKRNELKNLEWKQAQNDPHHLDRMKKNGEKKPVDDGFSFDQSVQHFSESQ